MNRKLFVPLLLCLVGAMLVPAGACGPHGKVVLKVINAGSLMDPFLDLEREFEAKYPDIDVQPEGHGSIQVIRYWTDLNKEADVAAVADEQLIPLMMYQAQIPGDKGPYADWYIKFAANRLCLAFSDTSAYTSEINADNWYDILARPDVRFGLPDPSIDSLGYRVFMLIQLAGKYYHDESMFQRLIIDNFSSGLKVDESNGIATIRIPELTKPMQKRIYMRNYSIQTLALLESGEIDYAFEYESVARQRGLNFVELPREIDMSSMDHADEYSRVRVKLDFQRFASVMPDFIGVPIVYGITIPRNAPHPEEAMTFVEYLFGLDGQRVMADNFQPTISPPAADGAENVPNRLADLIE